MKVTLSVCMIVKNEAKNLGRCLESILDIADEIIVVDTGSIDNTKAIALKYGAVVYDFEWVDDFSKARNYSLEKATGDWILSLDGDDELERKDCEKLKALINSEAADDIYLFNTVCYTGERVSNDKIMNVNLRLFKNRPDFRYRGRIHESIITTDPTVKMSTCDITVYHYGYLNSMVREQNKRVRNMRILEEQLKESPDSAYFLFCMGNEYFALGDYPKALEYFLSAYEKCNIKDVYVPKLLIRIIMSYQAQGCYPDALTYIEKTLTQYPQYTDVEFIKGSIYHVMGNFTQAIKSFQKCLDMGEPPAILNFIIGVGNYRAYHALGSVYHQMGDLREALKYYNQTLGIKNNHYDALYGIGSILSKLCSKPEELKQHLEKYFTPGNGAGYAMLADILFLERRYSLAIEYIDEALKLGIQIPEMTFLKAKCIYGMKRYEEAGRAFEEIEKTNKYYLNSRAMMLLCYYIQEHFESIQPVLEHVRQLDQAGKVYRIFLNLGNILQGKPKNILSTEAEESKEYLVLILDVLDALLCAGEFEILEKALELFNCIESDEVLLALGKLYNKYGFIKQAVKEIKRSISIFDKLDEESAYILYKSYSIR